jgi:hypothetical protein
VKEVSDTVAANDTSQKSGRKFDVEGSRKMDKEARFMDLGLLFAYWCLRHHATSSVAPQSL